MRALAWILSSCAVAACPRAAIAQVATPEVVATYTHATDAFTEGLLLHQGRLFESTGLTGRSSLRRVVPASGAVELSVPLATNLFGEGLALAGDRLIQLTWQNHIALVYDLDFNDVGTFDYEGEGWGLCHDGTRLVMSDGTARLYFRDPETFAVLGSVEVTRAGSPVTRLNELECVGRLVYANVWLTDTIVRIDPQSGEVLTTIDASNLLSAAEAANADVLNGIAFDASSGHFFLTGKYWPKLFEVRFGFDPGGIPVADAGNDAPDSGGGSDGTGGTGSGGTSADAAIGSGGASGRDAALPDKPVRSESDASCACRSAAPRADESFGALALLAMLTGCVRRSLREQKLRC